MNFIETIQHRHTLTTEELLNDLSRRLNLDYDNRNVFSALGMVLLAHSGDSRRKHDSCVNHILRVTLLASDLTNDSKKAMLLGLLHDIVEDYPEYITGPAADLWQHIRSEYGTEISEALAALTNPPDVEEEEKKENHTPVLYHKHIAHTLSDQNAAIIKLSDFTDNLMTVSMSDDEAWKSDLAKRYNPVIPLFEQAFAEADFADDLKEYFRLILRAQ